ncbi:MAG: PSD1 and planctomycete cytochrome C domain-containing protein [Chthoniobacteraceae bacterium]
MQPRPFIFAFASLGSFAFAAATAEPTKEQAEFFESKIRPILAEACYKCHSLEKGKSKGDLTLDTKEGLLKGGENGKIVVPGDPAKSPLVTAITYVDKDLQMPPKGEKLSDSQIALLTEWVKMGAPDPRKADAGTRAKLSGLTDKARQHWAYQPVVKPAIPATKNHGWPRTPVDAFILAKLEEKNMVPAPDATKEALLRRATYDLIGLPPTPAEVKAFVDDTTPQAFAKVVERLLASPHYGERWGRFWLDTARYSDTAGGESKKLKGNDYRYAYAWTYRDWVVDAFNKDLPYDQFIIQQLAADKVPKNPEQNLAALGFITVGERFKKVDDIINDRIDAVGKGFLGLTVACARCHDHMFDPIPTKDYYALHGVFASTIEPAEKPVIGETDQPKEMEFQTKLGAIEKANRDVYYHLIDQIQSEIFSKIDSYLLATRYSAGGKKAGGNEEEIKARTELLNRMNLDREYVLLVAKGGSKGGYARKTGEGKGAGRQGKEQIQEVFGAFKEFTSLKTAEFAAKAPAIVAQIATGKVGRADVNPLVTAAFKTAQPKSLEEVAAIYKKLFASLEPRRKAFLAASAAAISQPVSGFTPAETQIFNTPLEIMPALEANTQALRAVAEGLPNKTAYRSGFQFAKINELEMTSAGAPARAMLVADAAKPKDSPVFIRGQADVKGDVVPRHFLEILSPEHKAAPFKEGSGRYELAMSIANKSNPLTARVMVNRVWTHHFGEGFVRTLDDLGTQSEPPSHPELFDYLADYFMRQNWSLKTLHKMIMLSHVYQQSTRTQKEFETIDPDNRLLWRANVRRLDFEAMRDSLLVFSGQLNETIGGKPINLTDEPYSFRRSVYGYIDRGNLPELMQFFDFSDPDMPNSKRTSTVVPQQALFFMNSPMSVDVTRKITARPEVAAAPSAQERVFGIYRIIFQRPPTPAELELAYKFVGNEGQTAADGTAIAMGDILSDSSKKKAKTAAFLAQQQQAQQLAQLEAKKKKGGKQGRTAATAAIQNEGAPVERKPLTAWETYVQALLFSNEAAYVN